MSKKRGTKKKAYGSRPNTADQTHVNRKKYSRASASAEEITDWLFDLGRLGNPVSERDIAREFNLSAGVSRERVSEMRGAGLLEASVPGVGLVVKSPNLSELIAIVNVQMFIEMGMILSLAKNEQGLKRAMIQLHACQEEMRILKPKSGNLPKPALQEWLGVYSEFHKWIGRYASYDIALDQLKRFNYLLRPLASAAYSTPSDFKAVLDEHQQYLKALKHPNKTHPIKQAVFEHYQASLARYTRGPHHLRMKDASIMPNALEVDLQPE